MAEIHDRDGGDVPRPPPHVLRSREDQKRCRRDPAHETVGDWNGAPLPISETFPEGEQAAVILETPDGHIVAARLKSRSAAAPAPQLEADVQ